MIAFLTVCSPQLSVVQKGNEPIQVEHQCIKFSRQDGHNTILLRFVAYTECRLVNGLYNQLVLEAYSSSLSLHYINEKRYTNSWVNSSAVTKYSTDFLQQIRCNTLTNYRNFNLNSTTRSYIISLGIRKQPLFYKYH